jgi:hypothetical protein
MPGAGLSCVFEAKMLVSRQSISAGRNVEYRVRAESDHSLLMTGTFPPLFDSIAADYRYSEVQESGSSVLDVSAQWLHARFGVTVQRRR